MKYTIAFALAAMLVAVFASAASACPPCPDGMTQIDVNLEVAGDYCSWSTDSVDSQKFTVPEAGTFNVYGYVVRGSQDMFCETAEEFYTSFYTSIGSASGPIIIDGACGYSETLVELGTFDLVTGYKKNTVVMTSTAPDCGRRNWIPNDVKIERLCIAEVPPSAPEFPVPALASASVLAAALAAAFVARKK